MPDSAAPIVGESAIPVTSPSEPMTSCAAVLRFSSALAATYVTICVALLSMLLSPTTAEAEPVRGLVPCIAAMSMPLASFFAKPSAKFLR